MMLNFCFRRDYNTIRARRRSDKSTATDIKKMMTINQLKRNHSFKHRWKNDLYVDFLRKESVKRYDTVTFLKITNFFYLVSNFVCLIWFFTSHQQSFSYKEIGRPGLNQY